MSKENHDKTTTIAIGLLEFLDEIREIVKLPKNCPMGKILVRVHDLMETEFMYDDLCDGDHKGEDQ